MVEPGEPERLECFTVRRGRVRDRSGLPVALAAAALALAAAAAALAAAALALAAAALVPTDRQGGTGEWPARVLWALLVRVLLPPAGSRNLHRCNRQPLDSLI